MLNRHNDQPPRFCTQCQTHKRSEGGHYRTMNGGHRRRWICQECTQRAEERLRASLKEPTK